MSGELEQRAAVLEGLRTEKSAVEIISFFGYGKSFVYNIRKEFETASDKNVLTAERKIHSKRSEEFMFEVKATIDEDPSKSVRQLAKEMNVRKSTIHRAVHEDLGYQSFVLKRRQLLTEATMKRRKVKAQTLLNDLKRQRWNAAIFLRREKFYLRPKDKPAKRQVVA